MSVVPPNLIYGRINISRDGLIFHAYAAHEAMNLVLADGFPRNPR